MWSTTSTPRSGKPNNQPECSGFGQERRASAGSFCADQFDALIAPELEDEVGFSWVAPDADTWTFGDRIIQCLFVSPDGGALLREFPTTS